MYCLKISTNLFECDRNELFMDNDCIIIDVPDDPVNASVKYNQKIASQTRNDGAKKVQIMVTLTYLSYFRITLEMPLIICEINIF